VGSIEEKKKEKIGKNGHRKKKEEGGEVSNEE